MPPQKLLLSFKVSLMWMLPLLETIMIVTIAKRNHVEGAMGDHATADNHTPDDAPPPLGKQFALRPLQNFRWSTNEARHITIGYRMDS